MSKNACFKASRLVRDVIHFGLVAALWFEGVRS